MTRRNAALALLGLSSFRAAGQVAPSRNPPPPRPGAVAAAAPEGFRVYAEAPKLFLRPARLRLLRRERERQSLRWEQFQNLWSGGAPFPEAGWAGALVYQVADDKEAGRRATAWAASAAATDVRQLALIADWCDALLTPAEKTRLYAKLQRAVDAPTPKTLSAARDKTLAAIAVSEAQPDKAEAALRDVYQNYWLPVFIRSIRVNHARVPNADAYPLMELMHAFRDNLNFDLRDNYPEWFRDYPIAHVMAHYPAPFPAAENEYRIPADPDIQKSGPMMDRAMYSRAAELAMVGFDSNAASTQLLQGLLTNDRFLMRGTMGIPYEFMWANPYQPGLSYYHIPLALHDAVGGQLFVRSSWEDDAKWLGFFAGQLQLFSDGSVTKIDPKLAHEPMDLEEATVFFASDAKKFHVPTRSKEEAFDDVFIVGLQPGKAYNIEIDSQEMVEEISDPGGIIYLPQLPAGTGVLLNAFVGA
ncbi:MAG: hypothetical protein JWN34_5148 [Bryobacterales bacterium]|nr:hypothetical protein [Bryobacterales bacterium]